MLRSQQRHLKKKAKLNTIQRSLYGFTDWLIFSIIKKQDILQMCIIFHFYYMQTHVRNTPLNIEGLIKTHGNQDSW